MWRRRAGLMVLASTAKGGTISKIAPSLSGPVTTARTDEEGKRLLKESGMNFTTADSMGEAASTVVRLAH